MKTCNDFRTYYGIKDNWYPCCEDCHTLEQEFPNLALYTINLQNETYHVCCSLADFYHNPTIKAAKWILHGLNLAITLITYTFNEQRKKWK